MTILRALVRWLLVPVAAALVVAVAILGARWAVTLADARCPVDSMVGGACVEPWHTSVVEAVIYVAVALAALGLVALPSWVAPALKRTVAVVGFVLAAAATGGGFLMTGWAELLGPVTVAVVSGAVALSWILLRRRPVHES